MGLTVVHALGRNRKFFVMTENPAGTFVKPTAVDAAKIRKCSFGFEPERKAREDSRATRSLLERITGKIKVPWSVECEWIPSGTAGTPPDIHELLYAALGTYANSAGVSDTYSLSDLQTRRTMSMVHHYNDVVMESIWGAIVDTMKLQLTGSEVPILSFEGQAMGHAHTGTSTLNGAMSSATMIVQTADGRNFETNSVVKIAANDNTGAGWKVTADTSRPSFTVEGSVTADTGSTVVPFTPTETTAGSPAAGLTGSLSIGGAPVAITAASIDIGQNNKYNDDESFQQYISDVIPGWLNVGGELSFRARRDRIIYLGSRKAFDTKAVILTVGSVAGKRLVVTMPTVEFDFSAFEVPEAEEAIIKLPFTAKGSSGADDITIAQT